MSVEIGADRALAAREIAHVLREILLRLNRRGRHNPQRGRPTLRLLVQKPHVGRNERAGALDLEKIPRFLQIKSQGRGIDLQQLVLGAQRCQRQRRLCPGGEHDVAMRWSTSEEKRQRFVDVGIGDPMVILQEQIHLVIDVSQIIHQSRYDCAWIDQEALLDQVNRGRAHPFARVLQGVSQIEEEDRGLVIVGIDGEPRDCIAALLKSLQPSHRQRGLAEPCRPLDHGQTLFRKLRGGVHEPWTLDQPLDNAAERSWWRGIAAVSRRASSPCQGAGRSPSALNAAPPTHIPFEASLDHPIGGSRLNVKTIRLKRTCGEPWGGWLHVLRSPREPDRVPIAGSWTCLLRLERSCFFLGHAGRSPADPPFPSHPPSTLPRDPPFGGSREGRDCTMCMREKRRPAVGTDGAVTMATATAVAAPVAAAAASVKKAPKQLPAPNSDFYQLVRRLDRRGKGDRQEGAHLHGDQGPADHQQILVRRCVSVRAAAVIQGAGPRRAGI